MTTSYPPGAGPPPLSLNWEWSKTLPLDLAQKVVAIADGLNLGTTMEGRRRGRGSRLYLVTVTFQGTGEPSDLTEELHQFTQQLPEIPE